MTPSAEERAKQCWQEMKQILDKHECFLDVHFEPSVVFDKTVLKYIPVVIAKPLEPKPPKE